MARRPEKITVSKLFRDASQKAKLTSQAAVKISATTEPQIYDILTYISSEWGLQVKVFPVQRVIIKLYYNLPLDDFIPEDPVKQIQIIDPFTGDLKYTFSEKDYVRFLYNEGRCNIAEQDHSRRELILSCGRRSGKCVTADTLVLTDRGIFRLDELGDVKGPEYQPVDFKVAQDIGSAKAAYFYVGGIQPTYRYTTQLGLTLEGTGNHRVQVVGAEGIEWCRFDNLQVGDRVYVPLAVDLWPKQEVTLEPHPGLPPTLNENWASLLGYLVGNDLWSRLDALEAPSLRETLGYLGSTTRVPWCIRQSPKNVVAAFLSALFKTDVLELHGNASFSTPYLALAREVQALLLHVGYQASLASADQGWRVSISSTCFGGFLADPVVSITQGEAPVYDLNVPDGSRFIANGVVNHNTTLSSIFASYEVYRLLNLYNPQEYFGIPNGNRIQIISVATDKDQAGILFNDVTTHLTKCDYFKPYLANMTQSRVDFRTPYDIEKYGTDARDSDGKYQSINGKATIRLTFKSSNAKGIRGAGNIVFIMDEVAHFVSDGTSSAENVYKAISPSSAAFSRKDSRTGRPWVHPITGEQSIVEARKILISSPLAKTGLFYDRFSLAFSGGNGASNMLAIQAPTWEVNPTVPASLFREEFGSDPQSFEVEYGARFSDQARGWIEREGDLFACIDPELRPMLAGQPRVPHQMGIDIGLINDGTAISITRMVDGKIQLIYHELWVAGKSWYETNPHLKEPLSEYARELPNTTRLDFEAIADWILALSKKFYISKGLFDRWNGLPLEQLLHKKGLKQFTSEFFTRDENSKMYQRFKLFMYDERIRLYDFPIPQIKGVDAATHSPLIAEILSLRANQVSKTVILVEAPKKKHDDMSDSLIRASWLTSEEMSSEKFSRTGSTSPYASAGGMTIERYQRLKTMTRGSVNPRNPRNVPIRRR